MQCLCKRRNFNSFWSDSERSKNYESGTFLAEPPNRFRAGSKFVSDLYRTDKDLKAFIGAFLHISWQFFSSSRFFKYQYFQNLFLDFLICTVFVAHVRHKDNILLKHFIEIGSLYKWAPHFILITLLFASSDSNRVIL